MRAAVFMLLFVSYAYFYEAGGWNQNSRFDLVRAVTNDHALRIDPYEKNTGDKAVYEGHYYSDKAPGLALAAIPIAEAGHLALVAAGGDPETFEGLALLSYLSTVLTVGLLTALAGVVVYDTAIVLGAGAGGALFAATAFGLATPMWTNATLFQGHALAAAGLLFAFAAGLRIGPERDVRTNVKLAAAVGLSAGWATVTEFPAAIPAALLAGWAAARARPLGRGSTLRVVAALAAGALTCAAILMAYQYACFGSPFHLAYSSEEGFEGMRQGFFGINLPRIGRLRSILFGPYRGLLPLAPILAPAPLGLIIVVRRARGAALVSAAISVYFLLLNAGYTYWEGGWSFGPRHASPAIPFACLWLGALWTVAPRGARAVLLALWLWGASLSLLAVSTMAQPPAIYSRPVTQLLWPAFRDGDLALSTQTFAHGSTDVGGWRTHTEPKAAWNLGMKIGLSGHASLVPLALAWIACGAWLTAAMRRRPAAVRS